MQAKIGAWNSNPTLFVNGKRSYSCFYAETDCPGERWTWEEEPQRNLRAFAAAGFQLFQIDMFLELVWAKEGPLDLATVLRQLSDGMVGGGASGRVSPVCEGRLREN